MKVVLHRQEPKQGIGGLLSFCLQTVAGRSGLAGSVDNVNATLATLGTPLGLAMADQDRGVLFTQGCVPELSHRVV